MKKTISLIFSSLGIAIFLFALYSITNALSALRSVSVIDFFNAFIGLFTTINSIAFLVTFLSIFTLLLLLSNRTTLKKSALH